MKNEGVESGTTEPDHDLARVHLAVAWLDNGRLLNQSSLVLLVLAFYVLLSGPVSLFAGAVFLASLVCGVIQKMYGLRVNFDYRIFTLWAGLLEGKAGRDIRPALAAFDASLVETGLMQGKVPVPRDLLPRVRGACFLVKQQLIWLVGQFLLLLVLVWVSRGFYALLNLG